MARRRGLRITLVVTALVVVIAVVATVLGTFALVRRPLPQTSGVVAAPGLGAEVSVVRDAQGVAHIQAATSHDLFFVQGFTHAQDRFFEMDYRRHVTAGRLSELVGDNETALAADAVIRTLGWRHVAEQEWRLLTPQTRAHLQSYADGVNAYLASRGPQALALEYTVLGLQVDVQAPEPWHPVDSIAWLKAMAWDLKGNYHQELARSQVYAAVRDVERVDELFPVYPEERHAPILTEVTEASRAGNEVGADGRLDLRSPELQRALAAAQEALDAAPTLLGAGDGIGSNSWVVGPEHTATGAPFLANDPHLDISAPGIFTQQGLHCSTVGPACPYDVSGFTFAGLPGVIIGHNAHLAWALTNMAADVTDFYVERVDTEGRYLYDDEYLPLTERTETIVVNGGTDVAITVRSTGHGPIVSEVLAEVGDVPRGPALATRPGGTRLEVSLAWTALTPGRTADAIFAINTARTADDIAAAAADFEVPAQSILFATTDGTIGFQAPGRIPVRAEVLEHTVPTDGRWPRPGWDPAFAWQGFVEPEDMPRAVDPPGGVLVAANQAVTAAETGPFLTHDWDYGYRSHRIAELLADAIAAGPVDARTMADIQADAHSPFADLLVPYLLDVNLDNEFDASGQELLRDWDHAMDTGSAAAVYFAAVWAKVLELTFHDELPTSQWPDGGSRWLEVMRHLLTEPNSSWWDDRTTVGVEEGRDEILRAALVGARAELTRSLGSNPDDWSWGRVHLAAPRHPVLGGDGVPALVRNVVNPTPVAAPGGSSVVAAYAWDAASGSYGVTTGPGMRMVVDLGDLDSSTWVVQTGASGHPGSQHYDDQFEAWATGGTYPWPFTRAAVESVGVDRLTLRPAP